jgi:outer membrane protein assembly factor BamB
MRGCGALSREPVLKAMLLLLSISLLTSVFFAVDSFSLGDSYPQWRNQEQSVLIVPQGGSVSLQAEGFDGESLAEAVLCTNETGTWRNETEQAFSWMQPTVYGFDNFGTATYVDNVLYAPSKGNHVSEGRVYAVNASNGNVIWNVTARMVDGSPCVDGDVIYLGEGFSVIIGESVPNPEAMALNKTDGSEIWHYLDPNGYAWVGSPVVNEDFVYYTTGFYNYSTGFATGSGVYALNKTDGQKIWQTDIGFIVGSVAYDNGVVFVSGSNRNSPQGQYALNATDGNVMWHVNWGPSWDSSPVVYNGTVVQVIRGMSFPYAYSTVVLNESNGGFIRSFPEKGSQSTPVIHNGTIFIPDDDWRIWAYDLKTGQEIYHTTELHNGTLQNNSYCSPAAAANAIYYQSLNGTFYMINMTDGDVLWSYPLGGLGIGSPSIGDGCVFITNDAGLYAFKIGPGSGNWPMFCHTPAHISYSDLDPEYIRWPLTQPIDLGNASNTWVTTRFVWCNGTIDSAAVAWKILFFDGEGNMNETDVKVFYVNMTVHNVAAASLLLGKTVISQNMTLSINATVVNDGSYTETTNVTLYWNSTQIDMKTLTLEASKSEILTFKWNTTNLQYGNYTLCMYVEPVPSEIETSDNLLTSDGIIILAIAGDITGPTGWPDGKCDMRDIGLVARNFGQTAPPAPANCDVTGPTTGMPDYTIDMRDVGAVSRHFGEHYP